MLDQTHVLEQNVARLEEAQAESAATIKMLEEAQAESSATIKMLVADKALRDKESAMLREQTAGLYIVTAASPSLLHSRD
jgi:hypothetical protein